MNLMFTEFSWVLLLWQLRCVGWHCTFR